MSGFDGPKSLAEHLNSVGASELKYEAHFLWKKNAAQKEVESFQEIIDSTAYKFTSLCRICARLEADTKVPV